MAIGGLLVLVACADKPDVGGDDVVATLMPAPAIGTVASVHVEAPDGADVTVEVQEAGGPTRRFVATPAEGGGYETLLAGLAADVGYTWRAVATLSDGEERRTDDDVFHTAPPPDWAPLLEVTPPVDPWAPGFVGSTLLGLDAAYVVLDAQGRYVWWWRPEETYMVNNARLARDGRSVLVLLADAAMKEDLGTLVEVGLDGQVLAEVAAPGAHHDFVETPDGGIVYLAFDTRPWDGEDTIGDRLARLDRATGVTETLWSSWDTETPSRPDAPDIYSFGRDWTHANGLALDPETGDWLVSLHNLDTVLRIAWDGSLLWRMGGPESDFAVVGDEGFAFQHSPGFGGGEVLLFDNGRGGNDPSRAVAYAVDPDAGTYTRRWEFVGDGAHTTVVGGSVTRLPDGGALVGWGSAGRIERVDADGGVTWRVDTLEGSAPGFSAPLATLSEVVE